MIINTDTISMHFITDIMTATTADLRDSLAALDNDIAYFAELCIIDERDANSFDSLTFDIDPDDIAALDAASDAINDILADADSYDIIHSRIQNAIRFRLDN